MNIGKVPENALKRSVLRQIRTRREEVLSGAGIGRDCATLLLYEGERMVTCVQEGFISAGRKDVDGSGVFEVFLTLAQLIQKCANNLAVGGAQPIAVMIALLLPESTEEPDIRMWIAEAEEKCRELSMEITGGQTRITAATTAPFAVVTGYGKALESHTVKAALPGQDVVVSKWVGLQGTAIVARKERRRLLDRYPAYFVEEAAGFDRYLSILPEAATAVKSGVCIMHDASEGGILGALWELAEGAGVGLTIDMKKLPLRQETVEVCECCNVNPYELLSGGCLIMVTADGLALTAALKAQHIPAVIVGEITDSKDRILVNGEEVRYMNRPQQDAVYQLKNEDE